MLGTTGPPLGTGHVGRAKEISAWLAQAQFPRHVVILDDYDLSGHKFIGVDVFKVDPWLGLTRPLATQIIGRCKANDSAASDA